MSEIFPLVESQKYGADISLTKDGIVITARTGAQLGALATPPDPALLVDVGHVAAPNAALAAQHGINAYIKYESERYRIGADADWSETKKARELDAVKSDTLKTLSGCWDFLDKFNVSRTAEEAARYSVPPLRNDDVVGHLRFREIRDMVREEKRPTKRGELMATLAAGTERDLMLALLYSPFPIGDLEKHARTGWRTMVDKADPEGRERLVIAEKRAEWGERVLTQVQSALLSKFQWPRDRVYDVLRVQPIRAERHFGFDPSDVVQRELVIGARVQQAQARAS